MKYLVVSFILFFCTLQTFGQQEYFVYLQTDNSQAFYLRIHNNVYSSTASGYLLLSKLPDSTATVIIGFAKNIFPEQQFTIPANHKDAGYVLKNFGAKGWGLFNLQTLAVIMTSTPPEEKKNLELTGIKKSDAFSVLLANAVNDTAVLYAVNKIKKITPPAAVAVVTQNKPDTTSLVKETLPAKDSNVASTVTVVAEKKDSTAIAKNTTTAPKDSTVPAKTIAAVNADSIAAANKKKAAADSIAVVKNKTIPVIVTGAAKTTAEKNDAVANGKNAKPKKDTIIIGNAPVAVSTGGLKPKPERRDTIIMMKGQVMGDKKAVAKTTTAKNSDKTEAAKKTDSLQLVKNDAVKKPEEKTIVPANDPPPVIVPRTTAKNDTAHTNAVVKKDTASALVKTETLATPVEEKKDVLPETTAKRQRPLVNKVTELYTDTSYVAIFLDESKAKFDTIRISIPFFEAEALAKASENKPAPVVKKDTAAINKAKRDSIALAAAQQTTDSLAAVVQQAVPPVVGKKNDTTGITATDSAKTTKAPVSLNSDCKEIAWDSDIDKLRIKMLLVASDDDRIAVAKKVYKQKCFSVKQVKALSELFKSDEGKYKWFDAVYPFVSDSANFSSLAELLKNEYYLLRFKAMLRR